MKEVITYERYSNLIYQLFHKIKTSPYMKDLKFIYTFMRGGLPIAVHLSHFLDLPMYTDEKQIDFSTVPYKTVLVVDDIADTGKTLKNFNVLFPTATLFYKPKSTVKPTFYIEETTNWIVFPWERFDEQPNR